MDTKIIVALIAAFVSFIGLVITKEQKVSEFRQDWINKLREDISQLIGVLSLLGNAWAVVANDYKKNSKVGDQFLSDNITSIKEIDTLISKSKLRLNPEDDKGLINILKEIEDLTSSPSKLSSKMFEKKVNELEDECHLVFKTEWERVKSGELFYRIVKYFVGSVMLLLLTIVVMMILH